MTKPAPAGVLVVDKPLSLTSHDVVQRVRRASGVRRVGHAGTLDPLATGVLVVCVGWATRLVEYVQAGRKTYETTIRLGQTTTTYDAEGEVTAQSAVTATMADVASALRAFAGPISQQAPAFSAIKRDGQPLYKAARRGDVQELPVRAVTIYALDVLDYQPPDLRLRVVCSPGTYIRSLAHDLGQALGCGGHVAALRRTASGCFTVAEAVPLDVLTAANWQDHLLPPAAAVAELPRLSVHAADDIRALRQGRDVPAEAVMPDGLHAAFGPDECLLGMVAVREGRIYPSKMAPTDPT